VVVVLIHICLLHIIGSPVGEAQGHLLPHIHRVSRLDAPALVAL
jgi:hypothetical protein